MRKEGAWTRILLALLVLWVVATSYKFYRRSPLGQRVRVESRLGGDADYYIKPTTPELIRRELGRATWTFLHTVAAKYPAFPTREEQANALKLITLLTKLFPCSECRGHFTRLVEGFPPRVGSHEEFSIWMCEAHNIVNKRLNKPVFDCSRLDERWDCGCQTSAGAHR